MCKHSHLHANMRTHTHMGMRLWVFDECSERFFRPIGHFMAFPGFCLTYSSILSGPHLECSTSAPSGFCPIGHFTSSPGFRLAYRPILSTLDLDFLTNAPSDFFPIGHFTSSLKPQCAVCPSRVFKNGSQKCGSSELPN